jgi:hypothetical protein
MDVKSQLLNLKSIIRVFEEIYSTKKKKKKKKKKKTKIVSVGNGREERCNL